MNDPTCTTVACQELTPGTIVSVEVNTWAGVVDHYGIISDVVDPWTGAPFVIHKSKSHGCVVETSFAEFCEGKSWLYHGYPSTMPPDLVLVRARSRLGETYSVFRNCEHFFRSCHGLPLESPQLQAKIAKGRSARCR